MTTRLSPNSSEGGPGGNRRFIKPALLILFIIVFIISCFYYKAHLRQASGHLENKIAEIEKQKAEYVGYARETDRIKKKLALLNRKSGIMKTLEPNRIGPVYAIEAVFGNVIPGKMFFSELTMDGRGLVIRGISIDGKTVRDFARRLETIKNIGPEDTALFPEVQVISLETDKKHLEMEALTHFHIECRKKQKRKVKRK